MKIRLERGLLDKLKSIAANEGITLNELIGNILWLYTNVYVPEENSVFTEGNSGNV